MAPVEIRSARAIAISRADSRGKHFASCAQRRTKIGSKCVRTGAVGYSMVDVAIDPH